MALHSLASHYSSRPQALTLAYIDQFQVVLELVPEAVANILHLRGNQDDVGVTVYFAKTAIVFPSDDTPSDAEIVFITGVRMSTEAADRIVVVRVPVQVDAFVERYAFQVAPEVRSQYLVW